MLNLAEILKAKCKENTYSFMGILTALRESAEQKQPFIGYHQVYQFYYSPTTNLITVNDSMDLQFEYNRDKITSLVSAISRPINWDCKSLCSSIKRMSERTDKCVAVNGRMVEVNKFQGKYILTLDGQMSVYPSADAVIEVIKGSCGDEE